MMECTGIPNTPDLELTMATPASGNGVHISSSGSHGTKGSNVENTTREELALLDTFNKDRPEAEVDDAHLIGGGSMEIEGGEDKRPAAAGGELSSPSLPRRKYNRLSQEQSDLLEASFQQNHFPDKETKQALADTLKVTPKQVKVWFLNRRARSKKHKMEQNEELVKYKRQVESLTKETRHLRRKLKKLKKKLKLKQAPSSMAPPPPPPLAAAEEEEEEEEQQQHKQQIMYVPVLAGLFTTTNNGGGDQNVATTTTTTTASFITHQGSVTAAGLPVVTNVLLLPPPSPGVSNI